jgi:hypothetical protein
LFTNDMTLWEPLEADRWVVRGFGGDVHIECTSHTVVVPCRLGVLNRLSTLCTTVKTVNPDYKKLMERQPCGQVEGRWRPRDPGLECCASINRPSTSR